MLLVYLYFVTLQEEHLVDWEDWPSDSELAQTLGQESVVTWDVIPAQYVLVFLAEGLILSR